MFSLSTFLYSDSSYLLDLLAILVPFLMQIEHFFGVWCVNQFLDQFPVISQLMPNTIHSHYHYYLFLSLTRHTTIHKIDIY